MSGTGTIGDSSRTVATEFVIEEFETEVEPAYIERFASEIEDIVRNLRSGITTDDRLEALLRSESGDEVLRENDSTERLDPEPLTQDEIIEPLLTLLGYEYGREAGGLSDRRGRQADYVVSLRDEETIESSRLLIEAEPLNKRLNQDAHGLGQVKDWLAIDEFEADFGIATDGLRWVLLKRDRDTYGYDTLAEVNLQPVFLAAFENITGRQVSLSEWLEDDYSDVVANLIRGFEYGNFISIAGDAREVIQETKEAITDEFYDNYVQLVFGIVEGDDERADRSLIGEGVVAPDEADGDDVRLFAVELMNRLIFIKFLEDKGLVRSTLLSDLADTHESGVNPRSFYKTYLEPLFFGVLDERPSERNERIRQIDLYSEVPYLNGGLFRPTIEDGGDYDETDFDVRDSVLLSIIDLLERYTFAADGTPRELDPSILGHVFEKTINYITGASGDDKKELGAYYTPDEITSFCAEETVQPGLLDRFQTYLIDERDWPEAEVEGYDDVYDLIDTLPQSADLADALLDETDHFRALDPACGSGHFLTSVLSEVVEIRKAVYSLKDEDPPTWKLRKQTVIHNLYGVDIVDPAVEIAKLRLWLSIISEVDSKAVDQYDEDELALPNVVFNIRQGNSLIGYTELMETGTDDEQARLDAWGEDTVRSMYGDIIAEVERHKRATTTDEAMDHLEQAEALLNEYRDDLDEKVLKDFQSAGIENITIEQVQTHEPFHWVLEFAEVYADGRFDIIVGNPPWEILSVNRDDFFSRYDPQFRSYTSSEKDKVQEQLLEKNKTDGFGKTISDRWKKYQQNMKNRADYFNNSSAYDLQSPKIAGRSIASELDLSALFLERVFDLSRDDGRVAFVLPGNIFNGAASKDLRANLLDENHIKAIIEFENQGIFKEIHNQYRYGIVVFESNGKTDKLHGIFQQRDLSIIEEFEDKAVDIPRRVLAKYSENARIFPLVTHQTEVDVLNKILSHPPLEEDNTPWWADILTKEIHEPTDKKRLFTDPDKADYPVFEGKNIYQFQYNNKIGVSIDDPKFYSVEDDKKYSARYRVREKSFRKGRLKKSIYLKFGGEGTSKSQKSFVNDLLEDSRGKPLEINDILPDFTEYRIGYRAVANATNERTMIASLIPKGIPCIKTIQTFRPYWVEPCEDDLVQENLHGAYYRIFTDEELCVAVGLLNSLPFDYLMRTKIETDLVKYKIEESQVPRLSEGDDWFEYISSRAARLNCYGDKFEEMRDRLGGIKPATDQDERKRLRAEIDGAAFHAYGLDREETKFVLDDFHRVRNPRLMTENYFDLVLNKYDELAEEGPLP